MIANNFKSAVQEAESDTLATSSILKSFDENESFIPVEISSS